MTRTIRLADAAGATARSALNGELMDRIAATMSGAVTLMGTTRHAAGLARVAALIERLHRNGALDAMERVADRVGPMIAALDEAATRGARTHAPALDGQGEGGITALTALLSDPRNQASLAWLLEFASTLREAPRTGRGEGDDRPQGPTSGCDRSSDGAVTRPVT